MERTTTREGWGMNSKTCQRCGEPETMYEAMNWRRTSTLPNAPVEFVCNACLCGCFQCTGMTFDVSRHTFVNK